MINRITAAIIFLPRHIFTQYAVKSAVWFGLLALVITEGWDEEGVIDAGEHIVGIIAAVAMVLIMWGWHAKGTRLAYEGMWLAVAVWLVEFIEMAILSDFYEPAWWFTITVAFSMLLLCTGTLLVMRRSMDRSMHGQVA